eukprot:4266247-Amphidinium_carterae.1
MSRLHQHGLAPTNTCCLCGEQGTLEHRIFTCPRWERLQRTTLAAHVQGISNLLREVGRDKLAALRVPRNLLHCPVPAETVLSFYRNGLPTTGAFFTD